MKIDAAVFDELLALKVEKKFEAHILYPGAPNEQIRIKCEALINNLIDTLINDLSSQPKQAFVLMKFKIHLENFNGEDTEEKERVCEYCEQIMEILGIESSDGVLNNWLYGFDPNNP